MSIIKDTLDRIEALEEENEKLKYNQWSEEITRLVREHRQAGELISTVIERILCENEKLKRCQWTRDVYDSIANEGLPGQPLSQVIGSIIRERDSLKAHVTEVEKLGTEFVLKTANLQRDKEALEKALKLSKSNEWSLNTVNTVNKHQRDDELVADCIDRMVKEHGELTKELDRVKTYEERHFKALGDLADVREDVQRLQSDKNRYANKIYALEEVINDVMNAGSKALGKTY